MSKKTNPSIDVDGSKRYFNSTKPASLHPPMNSRGLVSVVLLQLKIPDGGKFTHKLD